MKIGITIDLSIAFWANGSQQNVVFLNHLLSSSKENECFYISDADPNGKLKKEDDSIMIDRLMRDKSIKLDFLIVAGLMLEQSVYVELKRRNKNIKIILLHCFNKLMDDIHYAISGNDTKKNVSERPDYLSEIWVLPHHEFSIEYMKAYYNFNEIRVVPYLWNSFFVDQKIKDLQSKGVSLAFKGGEVRKVCIFEPNFSHVKSCIIPIMICERFQQLFPGELDSVNVFSCERLRDKPFFNKFVKRLGLFKSESASCYFNNKWSTLAALGRWGNTVVSNQINNSLNYSHLEVLHLGFPLVHNSEELMNVGYYYPDFDIDMATKQLKSAMINHSKIIQEYSSDARFELEKFNPQSNINIEIFNKIINEIK
jgi:hypothetical protein